MLACSALASGRTTATVGIACSSVHCLSLASLSSRPLMPLMTTSSSATPAVTATSASLRPDIVTRSSAMRGLRHLRLRHRPLVHHAEDNGNEHQGCDRRQDQAADDGAAERRVLLAA